MHEWFHVSVRLSSAFAGCETEAAIVCSGRRVLLYTCVRHTPLTPRTEQQIGLWLAEKIRVLLNILQGFRVLGRAVHDSCVGTIYANVAFDPISFCNL